MTGSRYKMSTTVIDLKRIHVVIGVPALMALLSLAFKVGGDMREDAIMEKIVLRDMGRSIQAIKEDVSQLYSQQVCKEGKTYAQQSPTAPSSRRPSGTVVSSPGCVDSGRGAKTGGTDNPNL